MMRRFLMRVVVVVLALGAPAGAWAAEAAAKPAATGEKASQTQAQIPDTPQPLKADRSTP